MTDFTPEQYLSLIRLIREKGYNFYTFENYLLKKTEKSVILRHDIDARPRYALILAKILFEENIKGTFYFRICEKTFNEDIIKDIAKMGHEIGYHYEDFSTSKGDIKQAIELFIKNLSSFRKFSSVKTICMHGSPYSKYDNKQLWKYIDYKSHGILGEPYFDLDFSEVLYLTDTGRRWDGFKYNLRDKLFTINNDSVNKFETWKVVPKKNSALNMSVDAMNFQNQYTVRTTFDIKNELHKGILPNKILINIHPQRWMNPGLNWIYELIFQKMKNQLKYILIQLRSKN